MSRLFSVSDVSVTLYYVADEDETDEDAGTLLGGVSDELVDGVVESTVVGKHDTRNR